MEKEQAPELQSQLMQEGIRSQPILINVSPEQNWSFLGLVESRRQYLWACLIGMSCSIEKLLWKMIKNESIIFWEGGEEGTQLYPDFLNWVCDIRYREKVGLCLHCTIVVNRKQIENKKLSSSCRKTMWHWYLKCYRIEWGTNISQGKQWGGGNVNYDTEQYFFLTENMKA